MEIGTTLDIDQLIGREVLATGIANTWDRYYTTMASHREKKKELRNYIFATDTRTTSNSGLPWKNSTTIPKICQIRDNLHTAYMSGVIPNSAWVKWEGDNSEGQSRDKRNIIEAYMRGKVRQPRFERVVSQLLYDYIDEGNAYAMVGYVNETSTQEDGTFVGGYQGPVVYRINPRDIVFNIASTSFEKSPKIVRSVKTLGELRRDVDVDGSPEAKEAFDFAIRARQELTGMNNGDVEKSNAFSVDGFGTLQEYMGSGMVEILTFYGDFYDVESDELYQNHVIQIIDRSFVLSKKEIDRWEVGASIHHVGWRQRPDNLIAMGPLDNLVGMQYRIDHIENQKADLLDFLATPVVIVQGEVEEFEWQPGEKIYVGDEGSVTVTTGGGDVGGLDFQIQRLEQLMEEMAGAPKQAMGFRSPGEKTAFEVQVLDNSANKIFLTKAEQFEKHLLAPVLNDMLEAGRRNLETAELVKLPSSLGADLFTSISREDISASGQIYPVGASHFAKNANALQTLVGIFATPLGADQGVRAHFSGKKLAKLIEDWLDLKPYDIVLDNVAVSETLETQRLMQSAQQQLEVEGQTPAGIVEGDLDE